MFEEKLITAVAKRQVIYNKRLRGYRSKLTREKIWNAISEEVGWSIEECKGKWRSLRDRFFRVFKQRRGSSSSIKWKFYDSLQFLKFHLTPREAETSPDPAGVPCRWRSSQVKPGEDKREEGDKGFETFLRSMLTTVHCKFRNRLQIEILNFTNNRINEINSNISTNKC